jgi:hypothetical protein
MKSSRANSRVTGQYETDVSKAITT